eukprot:170506_1
MIKNCIVNESNIMSNPKEAMQNKQVNEAIACALLGQINETLKLVKVSYLHTKTSTTNITKLLIKKDYYIYLIRNTLNYGTFMQQTALLKINLNHRIDITFMHVPLWQINTWYATTFMANRKCTNLHTQDALETARI